MVWGAASGAITGLLTNPPDLILSVLLTDQDRHHQDKHNEHRRKCDGSLTDTPKNTHVVSDLMGAIFVSENLQRVPTLFKTGQYFLGKTCFWMFVSDLCSCLILCFFSKFWVELHELFFLKLGGSSEGEESEENILAAFVRTSQSIYQTEGVAGFFQGGAARALQIGMESCVFFTILEALKDGAKLILDF